MKKIVWMACGMALMCAPLSVSANVRYDDPQEKVQKKEVPNPEKAAQRRTDEMDKTLNLTEKQYKKIYKLFLKEEKEKVEAMMQRHPGGMNGQPPMAGRPPMGGEDALRWEVECHRRCCLRCRKARDRGRDLVERRKRKLRCSIRQPSEWDT